MIVFNKFLIEKFIKILVGIQIFLFCIGALFYSFGMDEFECMRTAWFIHKGLLPYKDFFQHHHISAHYLYSSLYWFLGNSFFVLLAARVLSLGLVVIELVYLIRIGSLVGGSIVSWYAAFFLFCWKGFFQGGCQVRPDLLQLSFFSMGLYYFLSYKENRLLTNIFLSGVFLAGSFLTLQKVSLVLVVLGIVLLCLVFHRSIPLEGLAYWIIVFLIPLGIYGYYLYCIEAVWSYKISNFDFNRLLAPTVKSMLLSKLPYFVQHYFFADKMLWGLVIYGIFQNKKQYITLSILMVPSFCLAAFFAPEAPQYHLLYIFIGSLLAAQGMECLSIKESYKKAFCVILLVPSFLHLLALRPLSYYQQYKKYLYCEQFLDEKSYVISNNNFFFPHYAPGYVWFYPNKFSNLYSKVADTYSEPINALEIIKKYKPTLIDSYVLSSFEQNDAFIKKWYKPTEVYPNLLLLK